jgi:hypothetical protein
MLTTPDHDDAIAAPTFSPVGPKPQGFFQDCDAATGEEGTALRAEDFNELALNLRQLVFTAAGVAPTKGSATMLKRALDRLFCGIGKTVSATGTLTPDDAGLVLVNAAANDVTLTLPAASALPGGKATFQFVRIDTSAFKVRIAPPAGSSLRGGVGVIADARAYIVRSDGVSVWYPLSGVGSIWQATTIFACRVRPMTTMRA